MNKIITKEEICEHLNHICNNKLRVKVKTIETLLLLLLLI